MSNELTSHEIEEVRELLAEKNKREAQRLFEAMDQYPVDEQGLPYDPRVREMPNTNNTIPFIVDEE